MAPINNDNIESHHQLTRITTTCKYMYSNKCTSNLHCINSVTCIWWSPWGPPKVAAIER